LQLDHILADEERRQKMPEYANLFDILFSKGNQSLLAVVKFITVTKVLPLFTFFSADTFAEATAGGRSIDVSFTFPLVC